MPVSVTQVGSSRALTGETSKIGDPGFGFSFCHEDRTGKIVKVPVTRCRVTTEARGRARNRIPVTGGGVLSVRDERDGDEPFLRGGFRRRETSKNKNNFTRITTDA